MKSPSESFAKLKEQMDQAARTVVSAASEDEAAVRAKIDDARATSDARAAELRARSQETSDAAASAVPGETEEQKPPGEAGPGGGA